MEMSGKPWFVYSWWTGKERDIRRLAWLLQLVLAVLLFLASARFIDAKAADVPVGQAELGPCSADFTVKDSSNKPIYDARINVIIRYGFMSLHKLEIEVGTNNDGKARFEGLPAKSKKPIQFTVRSGKLTKTITYDPGAQCHASFIVTLGTE